MKKELPPAVVWGVIAVIVIAVIGIGYKVLGPTKTEFDKGGSEQMMQKVKSGQPMYTPPAGAPVPGAPPAPGSR